MKVRRKITETIQLSPQELSDLNVVLDNFISSQNEGKTTVRAYDKRLVVNINKISNCINSFLLSV